MGLNNNPSLEEFIDITFIENGQVVQKLYDLSRHIEE